MAEENNVCADCGHEGPEGPGEGLCPQCGGEMTSLELLGEEDKERSGEEFGKEATSEEEL